MAGAEGTPMAGPEAEKAAAEVPSPMAGMEAEKTAAAVPSPRAPVEGPKRRTREGGVNGSR
jgi:hypothetical protein